MIRNAFRLLPPIAFALLISGSESCKPAAHPPPPASCLAACERLAKLDCTNGVTTSDGVECRVWMCETPICKDAAGDARRWGYIAAAESCNLAKKANCE